ncbi:MAG TPA: hypothetical protein V6C52_06940 [Coleofasciculaceae cyanobacterium]
MTSLLKSSLGGGGISSMMNSSGLGGLGFGGLTGGLTGGNMMAGANPLNPLQGASAVQGLGSFVNQVQTMGALRQMGYLPSTQRSNSSGGGDLMSQMMNMFSMLQTMMGGGSAAPESGGGQQAPFADNGTARDPMAEQLASMVGMLQALMASLGGQSQTVSAPVSQVSNANAFAGGLGDMSGFGGVPMSSFGGLGGMAGLGGMPMSGFGGLGGTAGLGGMAGLGGVPGFGGGGGLFSGIGDGFASIDNALNQTVGSVLGSLSLAKI